MIQTGSLFTTTNHLLLTFSDAGALLHLPNPLPITVRRHQIRARCAAALQRLGSILA